MRIDELPLLTVMMDAAMSELDKQYLEERIEPSSIGECWFSAIDGEISGVPDWHALMAAIYNSLKDEGLL